MLQFWQHWKGHRPFLWILLLALLVRVWGIHFGLPYAAHVDEPRYLFAAVGMWQEKTLHPGWFHQPTLYTYLIALVMGGYYLWGLTAGPFDTTADLFRPPYHFDGFIPLPAEFILARLLTVFLALFTIWAVYKLSLEWIGKTAAFTAALFLSLSILHVTASHFIATDAPVGLFIMASLYFCIRLAEKGKTADYFWVGVMSGLAVGSKYSAYVIVISVVLAHLVAWRRGLVHLFHPALIGLGVAAGITFFLTTPYMLFDQQKFLEDLNYEWQHNKVLGHIGSEGDTLQWLLTELLTRSDRWLTMLTGASFILAIWRRNWPVLLVSSFTLAYFISMSTNIVRFERFLVPMIPPMSVGAGYVLETVAQRLLANRRPLVALLVVLLLLEPLISVAQFDIRLSETDVREIARTWIAENLPIGENIARETFAPNLDNMSFQVQTVSYLNEHPLEWYQQNGFDYLIFAKARYGVLWRDPERYADLINQYETLWAGLELVATFEGPYVGRPNHDIRIYRVP